MEDLYLKNKHSISHKTLNIETFAINDVPVCLSWIGCDKHKREACQFLLQRKFGTVLVCGLTGDDLPQLIDEINQDPCKLPVTLSLTA